MTKNIYPLLFTPAYKDYLWGGHRLAERFQREIPPGPVAESWEVSDRDDGMGTIRNGALSGQSFRAAIHQWGTDLLGTLCPSDSFPLLIKLIDATQCLSVQVHPDDQAAARHGGEAKTEMWYLLDADPHAAVYAGFKPGIDAEAFQRAVNQGHAGDTLNRIPVSTGDAIFIPGGLVHAIDAGCLILEVQQNSNTTYRIFDWNRVGPDGKPRELHLDQAMEVIRFDVDQPPKLILHPFGGSHPNARELVVESPYFRVERIDLREPQGLDGNGQTFVVIFIATGSTRITWPEGEENLPAGTSCLIPANLRGVSLAPTSLNTRVLKITLPVREGHGPP